MYYLLIQIVLFVIFATILVHMLNESVKNKVETNLKVIILDIKDDILEHNNGEYKISLNKEVEEFQIKPLHIRLLSQDEIIETPKFPNDIGSDFKKLQSLDIDQIYFRTINEKVVAELKMVVSEKIIGIQVATQPKKLAEIFPNLNYILLFISPILLLFSIVMGNFLIRRSFKPIELLLEQINSIEAKSLSSRVTVFHPNDEIGQITQQINKLLERLETSYKQISQFTSDASHELKTPLTILRGEVEVALKEERSTQEYKKTLQVVHSEILNVQTMVENLLLLAKVENNTQLANTEVIYLDETLTEATSELRILAQNKKIQLNLEIKDLVSILGNQSLIKIIFKNIIENGIFYSKENSKVNITLYKENQCGYVQIEDFGIGMSEENIQNIFKKFYRADESRSKHTGGTGLGMSLVEKIASLHHIQIQIKSTISEGTKILLQFSHIINEEL